MLLSSNINFSWAIRKNDSHKTHLFSAVALEQYLVIYLSYLKNYDFRHLVLKTYLPSNILKTILTAFKKHHLFRLNPEKV